MTNVWANEQAVKEIVAKLSKAQRKALRGAHPMSSYTSERCIFYKTPLSTRQALVRRGLIFAGGQLRPLGQEVFATLQQEQSK